MTETRSIAFAGDLSGALWRYRLMAYVVGVMLLFLCVVAIPLQFAAGKPEVADVGFTLHGILYIIYLLSVADLGRRSHFRLTQLLGLVCAGFLPGLAFYVENRTTKRFRAEHEAELSGSG
jgi:integral membrane protein